MPRPRGRRRQVLALACCNSACRMRDQDAGGGRTCQPGKLQLFLKMLIAGKNRIGNPTIGELPI